MRRTSQSGNPSMNLQDYGNMNLKDLGNDESPSLSNRAAPKRGSIFSGFNMGAMFEDELVDTKKPPAPPSASMLRNPSGRIVTKQGVAHQVISDDVQWKKLQEQMRQKGATSGMTLKQNLNGLLQDRAKELPSQSRKQPALAGVNRRRTSYITDFATSLILGEPDPGEPARRMSLPTQRKPMVPQVQQPERRRFSAFFAESAVPADKEGEEEPTIILERYSDPGPEFAPSIDLSRKSTDFEKPQKRGSTVDSINGSTHSHVIYEGEHDSEEEDSDKDQPPMARAHRNPKRDEGNLPTRGASSSSKNRSPRWDPGERQASSRSLGSVNKSGRNITRGTEVVW